MRIPGENVAKEFKGEKQHDVLKKNAHEIQYNVAIIMLTFSHNYCI